MNPGTEDLIRSLPQPFLLVGNGPDPLYREHLFPEQDHPPKGGGGIGVGDAFPYKTVVRFNNFQEGRCDLWITSCWHDVPVRDVGCEAATIYTWLDHSYNALIAAYSADLYKMTGRRLHVARERYWRRDTIAAVTPYGTMRPTTGLMTAYCLRELGIKVGVTGFTGKSFGHKDECESLSSLGIKLT